MLWRSKPPFDLKVVVMRVAEATATKILLRSPLPVALCVFLLLCQLFAPSRVWIALLCCCGGMLLTAWLWSRSLARSVVVSRSLRYTWAQVGDLLEEEFVLHNRGWWPLLWAEIDDRSTLPEYPSRRVVAAGGGESFRWRVRTTCRRRGVFTLGPWVVRMTGPFGLFTVSQHYDHVHTIVVVPPVVDLPGVTLPQGMATGRAVARRPTAEATLNVATVRRYMPGDPLRRIHWPSSAHCGELMSRAFDAEVSGDLWIVLDMDADVQAGEGEESTGEYGVILAASLGERVLRRNRAVGLVAFGTREVYLPPGRGEGHLYCLLRSLALVQAGAGRPLAAVLASLAALRSTLGREATLVVITPSCDPAWVEALASIVHRGVAVTAVLLDPASFDERGGDLAPVRDMLAGLGVLTHTIGRGHPFRLHPRARAEGNWEFKVTPMGRAVAVRRPREASRR